MGYPLYIGVELSLGITILNKFCGVYGLLALFTGHPLGIMQWVFYLWSVAMLLIYINGLSHIYKPKLMTYCLLLVAFTLDTILSCFFTLWFTKEWFTEEDNSIYNGKLSISPVNLIDMTKRNIDTTSQSATQQYEYFATIFLILLTISTRFYSNFIIASFVQKILLHPKYSVDISDIDRSLKGKNIIRQWFIKVEIWCYYICRYYL